MKSGSRRSYIMMITAMLIFGTIGIFRRYIPVASSLLACIRGFLGLLFLLAAAKLTGRNINHKVEKKDLFLLIVSGGLIGFNWILLFESYNYTTVATATLCYYMAPTIIILLSPLVLKEKLTARKLICALVSVLGMVFVAGLMDGGIPGPDDIKGIALGLGAAVLYAMVIFMNKLIKEEDSYLRTMLQLGSAAVVLVPYNLLSGGFSNISLDVRSVIMILIVGIVHTGVAYTLYFDSMKELSAQSTAILSYVDPVSALILSALILGEKMSVWGITGAVLIIASAIISELKPGSEVNS